MSLSVELKNTIWKEYIKADDQPAGKKLPTVTELARQYGVSTPTIGKAVAMLAAEGWVIRRKGSGVYIADKETLKTRLAKPSTQKKIGYIASDISIYLAHQALRGIEYVARQNDIVLELANTNNNVEEERRQVAAMRERGVDGIVLYPAFNRQHDYEYLGQEFRDFPIVVIDLYEPRMKRPHLLFDNYTAGRELTEHLIRQGHTNICFLTLDVHPYRSVDDRIAGYKRAISEADLNLAQQVVINLQNMPLAGYHRFMDCVKGIIELNPQPTALMVFYDYIVPDIIRCFEEFGLSVPEDVTLTGFDNLIHDCRVDWPTTGPDFVRMGEWAAELLIECMETEDANNETRIIMPCPLVVNKHATVPAEKPAQALWRQSFANTPTRKSILTQS